jgi:hypothetical protein
MGPGLEGNVPEELRELGRRLAAGADLLEHVSGHLTGQLRESSWCGADADQTRHTWDTAHARTITVAATALREAAGVLAANAGDQVETSSAAGGALSTAIATGIAGGHGGGGGWGDGNPILGALDWGKKGIDALLTAHDATELYNDIVTDLPKLAKTLHLVGVPEDLMRYVSIGDKWLPFISVPLDAFDVVHGLQHNDVGEVALNVAAIGLTVAAAVVAAPEVAAGLGIAAAAVGIAKEVPVVRNLVGDELKFEWHVAQDTAKAGASFVTKAALPFAADLAGSAGSYLTNVSGDLNNLASTGNVVGFAGNLAGDTVNLGASVAGDVGSFASHTAGVAVDLGQDLTHEATKTAASVYHQPDPRGDQDRRQRVPPPEPVRLSHVPRRHR